MNIFATYKCPTRSAIALDDKRVIKMVLESAQILSTAINKMGGEGPYKTTHMNHPCSIWARLNKENYKWLLEHFEALCREYTWRYGKIHKCMGHLKRLSEGIRYMPSGAITPFANCAANHNLGLDFKSISPAREAYRKYLVAKWKIDKREPKWTKREKPIW